ncbi:MAG: outer membrane beta-barrel protein [Gemmatimonadetes bacterium]|nr:outer membrane beta-barrel protein [Gemmatimonadota bacterium]
MTDRKSFKFGFHRLLFRTALIVVATVSSATYAQTSNLNIETTPARVSAASFARGDFYVLGAATLDLRATSRFQDRNCSSETPAALYGCGTGADGENLSASGEFARAPGFEVGAGYVATTRIRVEATVLYRPRFSFNGRANFVQTSGRQDVSADVSSLSALASAYADLPGRGPFSPFLGCGVGLSRNTIGETRMEFPRTTTVVPGASRTGFAFMLTTGAAARVWERVYVDVGWRYLDAGAVETGRGKGRIVWRDGSRQPLELDLAETRANLSSHGLRVSLRYGL